MKINKIIQIRRGWERKGDAAVQHGRQGWRWDKVIENSVLQTNF